MISKKKFVSVGYGAVVAFLAFASISFASIDYAPVQALITSAVVDVVSGGLILVGAYAGFWGIRKVRSLFLDHTERVLHIEKQKHVRRWIDSGRRLRWLLRD